MVAHALGEVDFLADAVEPLDLPEDERTRRTTHPRLRAERQEHRVDRRPRSDLDDAVAHERDLWGADWHESNARLIVLNTTRRSSWPARTCVCFCAGRGGQPSCVTACAMGGTTGPATTAGTLVVQHAEVLAALVVAQGGREGSPFVYGGLSTMSDLRTGTALFGTAEFAGMAEATVGLARLCGLPVRAGARRSRRACPGLAGHARVGALPGRGHARRRRLHSAGRGVLSSCNSPR